MPDGVTIQLVGDVDLIRKLGRLEKRDAKKAVRRGTRAGAKIIHPVARSLTPKGEEGGGTQRQAIRVRATKRSRNFIGAVVRLSVEWFRGKIFYGGFGEWGWKSRGGRQIPGKLTMERAAKRAGRQAGHKATTVIRDEIEQAARR